MPSTTRITFALADKLDYLKKQEKSDVLRGLQKATEWHDGQLRASGKPYIEHPVAVAEYLTKLEAGRDALIAALLHDVVEDGRATLQEIEKEFGTAVKVLVDGVTKLSKFHYEGRRSDRQLASLRKMLLTAHDDLRVIFIKLADRWHNVQTLKALSKEKQERIALETLEIYVPFARLVGLWKLKAELEEVCFPIAYPEASKVWKAEIKKVRSSVLRERRLFVKRINEKTTDKVIAEIDLMTDYEVYNKFQGNISRIKEVRSLDTVHIMIQEKKMSKEMDCYKVLGEIHKQYPVLMGSFRDYISAPQPNGYMALHTTIFLSENHLVRLRIQTEGMHKHASSRRLSDWRIDPEANLHAALSSLQVTTSDDNQYVEDLKQTVLKRRINIFSPMGEIISLPQGSTGVDYAFAINPDHLRFLEAVHVNGELVLPTHTLQDGDSVSLVLLKNGKPTKENHRMWLEKVKSVEAREGLKKTMKQTSVEHRHKEARQLLFQELQKQKLPYKVIFHVPKLQKQLAESVDRDSFDDVLKDLGTGIIPISAVVDAYKEIVSGRSSWTVKLLSFFHLLPQSRVMDKASKIIDIEVYAKDRRGLIHDVTKCFAERELNIVKFGVFALPDKGALYKIRLEVENFDEFSELYDFLLQVPSITKVLRKK